MRTKPTKIIESYLYLDPSFFQLQYIQNPTQKTRNFESKIYESYLNLDLSFFQLQYIPNPTQKNRNLESKRRKKCALELR